MLFPKYEYDKEKTNKQKTKTTTTTTKNHFSRSQIATFLPQVSAPLKEALMQRAYTEYPDNDI